MRIQYRNTYFDMLVFSLIHQFLNPIIQGMMLIMSALVVVPIENHDVFIKILTGIVFFVSIWLFQALFTAVYLISRKNSSVITQHILEVRDDCLYEETSFNRSFFYWKGGVVKAVKRGTYIAFYVSANAAHIVPRRAFDSKSQQADFYHLLKEKSGV
jgi:hypothetical protein